MSRSHRNRADVDGAPVRCRDRLGIEGEVDAVQSDGLRCRGGIRIAHPANAAEDRRAEGRTLGLDGELLQIKPHLRGYFGRDIRIGDHLRDLAARHFVAAEAVIEDAEFKLQARSVGREDQHALQRADGRLYVTDLDRKRRIFEGGVEVVGLVQHCLEKDFAAGLDLLQVDTLDLRGHDTFRRRLGLRQGVTGHEPS